MTIDEKNIKKLEKLFSLMDSESLTKEDFVKSFELVVNFIKSNQDIAATMIDSLATKIKESFDKMKMDYSKMMDDQKKAMDTHMKMCDAKMARMQTEHNNNMRTMEEKMKQVQNERNIDEKKIVNDVLTLIPATALDTPQELRNKLESLNGNERIDITAIKGLDTYNEKSNYSVNKSVISFGGRRGTVLRKYSLTSQCNGSTKIFSLPIDTREVLGVFGTQFPVQFDPSGDWTFEGRSLTLGASVAAPETGQTLWVLIETL